MKTAGFLLLLTGWLLVLSAIALLVEGASRNAFVGAGFAVELLGLVLTLRAHLPHRPERG